MKRVASIITLVGVFAAAYAVSSPVLTGRGIVDFASPGHGAGRGSFEVSVRSQGKKFVGRLIFSAEGIHIDHEPSLSSGEATYPDIVVAAESLDNVVVNGSVATITTKGTLHLEPVILRVVLTDSRSKSKPDRFFIRCDRPNGQHLFHVEAPLTTGDIDVR